MNVEQEIRQLKNRIAKLESQLRRTPRLHRRQDVAKTIVRADPASIKASSIGEGEGLLVKNPADNKKYLLERIEGEIATTELT